MSGNLKVLGHEAFRGSDKFVENIHSIYRNLSVTKSALNGEIIF
jgi:hypothetical protein